MAVSFNGFTQSSCRAELNSFSKKLPKTKTVEDLNLIISKVNKIEKEIIPNLLLKPNDKTEFDGMINGINTSIKDRSEKYSNFDYIVDLKDCEKQLDKISYKDKRFAQIFGRFQANQLAAKSRTFKPAEEDLYDDAVGSVKNSMRKHTLTHLADELSKCQSDLYGVLLKSNPKEIATKVATILDKVDNIRQESENINITAQEGVEFEKLYRSIDSVTAQIDQQWLSKTPDPIRKLRRQLDAEVLKLENFQKQLIGFTSRYHNRDLYAQIQPQFKACQDKFALILSQLNGQNKTGYETDRVKRAVDASNKIGNDVSGKLNFNPGVISKVAQFGIYLVSDSYANVANRLKGFVSVI